MFLPNINSNSAETGFTLVELMIALFVSALAMAAVISVYIAQSRSYSDQNDIANIQQDLRGVLAVFPLEIRKAGCDPLETGIPGILSANVAAVQFTMDLRGSTTNPNSADGDVNDSDEIISYGFAGVADSDGDGIVDNGGANWSGTASIGRASGAGALQPLADNIEAMEFNYILDSATSTTAPTDLNRIRAIQISILARAANPAKGFLHNRTYTTASGTVWTPPQDNFRRRLIVSNIQCRNMGY